MINLDKLRPEPATFADSSNVEVGQLALAEGAADRLIIHDVVAADGDGGGTRASDPRLCAAHSADGALVLGHNSGWAWSFARGDLHGPC